MSKTEQVLHIAKGLRSLATNLEHLASVIEGNDITPSVATTENVEKQPTLEDVRVVLAQKNRDGHREVVKGIINKYGVNKLTALDPKHYLAVLKEAGEIQ